MRFRKRLILPLVVTVVIAGTVAGLLQVDLVHQYVEIAWLQVTGKGWHLRGHTRTYSIWSPALNQYRAVIVYTPPGYDSPDNSSRRYPVLYLLHGSPDPGFGWENYGRGSEEVDRLIVLEHYPPMLVVMPDGNGQGMFGDSEFIDAPAKQKNGKPGLKVGTYIVRDVVNWTDQHYRTINSANGRLIGGVSTGGYAAANLGMQNPDEFGVVMSFSGYYRADPTGWARPVWGYHPASEQLFSQSPYNFVTRNYKSLQNMIVILGDGESDRGYYRRDTDRFAERLSACGIQVQKFRYPGRHSWDLWRALLRTSLRTVRDRVPNNAADSN